MESRMKSAVLMLAVMALLTLTGCNGTCSVSNPTSTPGPTPSSPNEWTWVSGARTANQAGSYGTLGTAAPGNVPGARAGAMSWMDADGNLWLFGGEGFSSTWAGTTPYQNDLWKFSGGEWTWMGGSNVGGLMGTYGTLGTPASGNVPGGRVGAATWVDNSGNLWLFGGFGDDSTGKSGDLNDLWEYQP